ncbi:helix-turn-helix domain-containing protein [Pontimicrobium aquaticum]|uniref:Helix-turn-helix domain-containing protein n=1 Tax=Pontimicrobium aquaticum TaxID=2565367 RepID=A0A4U0EW25_9FLAO|nr:helix-turn-helix domain-containing protein [Pontimicrobium aquaticum]TJY36030.1 helix-turn-helix domain-containing protein [Pontimicrobium aquaticum]
MVSKFSPEINKVYFINQYSLFQILSGHGSIEVDFKAYLNWQDKIIYLEKGQYIKFLSDDFEVRQIVFNEEAIFKNKDVRVLFKHLISLGYINFNECEDCQKYLQNTVFSSKTADIVDISSKQWFWQNPFHANKEEYHLIFDVKDVIDEEYKNHLTNNELAEIVSDNGYQAQALIKDKVGISLKNLLGNKRLLESKKEIAFTDKSVQEISYELGYKDAAYFNRVFKAHTGKTPKQFRSDFDFQQRDSFAQNIFELIHNYHAQEQSLGFYANKMNLSIKALSKKVKDKTNISLGQLIRLELTNTAKRLLSEGVSITNTAYQLGFEEPNHFSTFFKKYSGETPSQFQNKKYNF